MIADLYKKEKHTKRQAKETDWQLSTSACLYSQVATMVYNS